MFNIISTYLYNNIRPFARYASGQSEINCRCPYCGDSKNQNKGHLYIKNVPGHVFSFFCQKCNTTGFFNNNILLDWGLFDPDIAVLLTKYNKECIGKSGNTIGNTKYRKYRLTNKFISNTRFLKQKVRYIENRIGVKVNHNFIIDNKIILNLADFLNSNNLEPTRHPNIISQLDDTFIGFLSYDNSFVNLRNLELCEVYKTINRRYINYNTFTNVNSVKYYIIPTQYDILSIDPIRINISEGPFDILSIFCNLRNQNRCNELYLAVIGNTYESALKFVISELGIMNIEVHLYVDNDVPDEKIQMLAYNMSPFGFNIYVHHNTFEGEKDYGVPLSKINDVFYKVI